MNKFTESLFLRLTCFSLFVIVSVGLLMYAFLVLANSSCVNENCKGKWILVNLCIL
jgi:hypothetical protein